MASARGSTLRNSFQGGPLKRGHRGHRSYPTVTLLLLAVNTPLAVFVVALLVIDYQREIGRAANAKRVALRDEASLIGKALLALGDPGEEDAARAFVEGSCAGAAGSDFLGHRIDAHWNGRAIHTHAGSSVLAPGVEGRSSPSDAIAGRFSSGALSVRVSESASGVRRAVRNEMAWHVTGLLGMAGVAALIVDIVLVRIIAQPTTRLANAVARVGKQQFDVGSERFLSRELNELSHAVRAMASSLRVVEGNRATAMERAQRIQRHLLPHSLQVPGLIMASHYQPAEEVAGDIYGVLRTPDGAWLLYIADLVGHGVPAAMSASILKMMIESAAGASADPGEILHRVNQRFPKYLSDGEFATAAVFCWRHRTSQLFFASAGHEPALLLKAGELELLQATGLPLGVDLSLGWTTQEYRLQPGDRVLLGTDGLAEACDATGNMFGRQRIAKLVEQHCQLSVDDLVRLIADQVNEHTAGQPPEDDITLLAAECAKSA